MHACRVGIFGQRYASNGVPSGFEFRVTASTTGDQLDPGVAVDESGVMLVVWASDGQDGSGYGVFGQRFNQIVPVELTDFEIQ